MAPRWWLRFLQTVRRPKQWSKVLSLVATSGCSSPYDASSIDSARRISGSASSAPANTIRRGLAIYSLASKPSSKTPPVCLQLHCISIGLVWHIDRSKCSKSRFVAVLHCCVPSHQRLYQAFHLREWGYHKLYNWLCINRVSNRRALNGMLLYNVDQKTAVQVDHSQESLCTSTDASMLCAIAFKCSGNGLLFNHWLNPWDAICSFFLINRDKPNQRASPVYYDHLFSCRADWIICDNRFFTSNIFINSEAIYVLCQVLTPIHAPDS